MCGSKIADALRLQANAKGIAIGGGACAGNTMDSVNLSRDSGATILDNHTVILDSNVMGSAGATQIFGNQIGGNLTCTDNSSITGGNTAKIARPVRRLLAE